MRTTPPTETGHQIMLKQRSTSNQETDLSAEVMEDSERSLHRVSSSLGSYQATPITKHYALNNQILTAFESNYERKCFKIAYAIGLQFVETALLEIPKHGYFYSSRHESDRLQSSFDAQRVTRLLMEIQEKEGNFASTERERIYKLTKLAQEQAKPVSSEAYESDRAKVEAELRSTGSSFPDFCGQFMFFDDICPPGRAANHLQSVREDSSALTPFTQHSQRGESSRSSIPAPPQLHEGQAVDYYYHDMSRAMIPPPVSKPTFSRTTSELEIERALFLSGLEVCPRKTSTEELDASANYEDSLNISAISRIDIVTLSELYREDFDSLLETKRVRISRVATYQGRTPGSINGCTLIAPLLCIHHFHDQHVIPDPGLPDSVIIQAIDQETPEILRELRGSLGLTKDAFIIPSDAHDYLIGRQLLSTDQFVNVCGGNILDDEHVNSFVQVLASADSKTNSTSKVKKVACTLFFHEHVVAIHRLERENGKAWYDIIDSLPLQKTLRLTTKMDESRDGPPKNQDILDLYGSSEFQDFHPDLSEEIVQNTARIRCLDLEALKATLRWYACSKFSRENRIYIDQYPWSDMNTDFDPRVFQTFVWKEA
jgi:hypothetical protein